MGQLSRVATTTRKVIKYGALGLVTYLIVSYALKYAIAVWRELHPPPGPPPTVAFGKINSINFPDPATDQQFSFRLETPTGTFPEFEDQAVVYALPPNRVNLLSPDRVKELAAKLGFTGEPTQISPRRYQFTKQLPALLTMKIDSVYQTFLIEYQWQNDESILLDKQVGSLSGLQGKALGILGKGDLLAKDLEDGKIRTTYLKAAANSLVKAVSLSEADFVRVDIFRQNQELSFVTPDYDEANVNLILTGSSQANKDLIRFEYSYYPIDYNSRATYPLKPVETAWEELKQGQSYIARVESSAPEEVPIRRIFLALYDPDQYQLYSQPVYVFQGDYDFVAYVPAITSDWLK